jgi:hypothetical protein
MVGAFTGTMLIGTQTFSGTDVNFVAKFDTDGNLLWLTETSENSPSDGSLSNIAVDEYLKFKSARELKETISVF